MMQRKVNPLYGWRWFREGFRLFSRGPVIWFAMLTAWFLVAMVVSIVPVLGLLVVLMALPAVAAGFMAMCRVIERDQVPDVSVLLSGFKTRPGPLMAAGGVFLVGVVTIALIISTGWGEQMGHLAGMSRQSDADPAAMQAAISGMLAPFLVAIALLAPLSMALWFAPALIYFQQATPMRALLESFWASLRNFAPFIVLGLLLFAADVILSFVLRMVMGVVVAIGGAALAAPVGFILALPVLLGFMAVLLGAMYISYVDVFETQPRQVPEPSQEPESDTGLG